MFADHIVINKFHAAMARFRSFLAGPQDMPDELAGRFRAEQLRSLKRIMPYMMLGNLINAALLAIAFYGQRDFGIVVFWAATIAAMSVTGLWNWQSTRNDPPRLTAPERAIVRAKIHAATLGTVWGVFPLIIFPHASDNHKLMIATVMAGMLCGGGFALSYVPRAMVAYVLPVAVGTLCAMVMAEGSVYGILMVLLMCYVAIVAFACFTNRNLLASRHLVQAETERQQQIIGLLLRDFEENSSDWLWETDDAGRLLLVSDRFGEALSQDSSRLQDVALLDVLKSRLGEHDLEAGARLDRFNQVLESRRPFRDVSIRLQIDGKDRWLSFTGKPLLDPETGGFTGFRGVASDITRTKETEKKIAFLARHDALTGLLNRVTFREHLTTLTARQEATGSRFVLALINIDRFKAVNNTQGHPVGDQLLKLAASRLRQTVPHAEAIARTGSDEFAVICTLKDSAGEAVHVAERLVEVFSEPFSLSGRLITTGASIGLAVAPDDGNSGDQLFKCANLALSRSKQEATGGFRFFESAMDAKAQARIALEVDLRRAVNEGQLDLAYQPLIDARNDEVAGFEALLRWKHPQRGHVSPAEFVPVAEEMGLINEIGRWVLREACKDAANWPSHLTLSVNLSTKQFDDQSIVKVIRSALKDSGLPPSRLEVEITESVLIANWTDVLSVITELKALGVAVAMDDFGTGYSSLSSLWKFPFDRLKIDRSFVAGLSDGGMVKDILRTISMLGKTLDMQITVEGVENEEQLAFLRNLDCDNYQGFYFSRPLPRSELAAYLLRRFGDKIATPPSEAAAVRTGKTA